MKLGKTLSNLIVSLYILGTLYIRFLIEPQLNGHVLVSLGLGLFALLFLWALIKSKILNPSFW